MSYRIIPLVFFLVTNCAGFFNFDLSIITNGTVGRSNLTCLYYGYSISDCDYCVYQFFSDGSDSTIVYDSIRIINAYKSNSRRCEGFSDAVDIGYGVCSALPFELFDISILCICATDMCNQNLTSCQSSVTSQMQANSAPPALLTGINELVTPISCIDTMYPTESDFNISYYCAFYSSPYIDMEKCNNYVVNNTVLCACSVSNGSVTTVAFTDDNYRSIVATELYRINQFGQNSTTNQFYNETSSYFYYKFNLPTNTAIRTVDQCLCVEDNCNSDLTSCLNANQSVPMPLVNSAQS